MSGANLATSSAALDELRRIPAPDLAAGARAKARLDSLTKPRGSLGRLEALAVRLAEITACERPCVERKLVIVAAGDHGVVEEGVAAYPKEVTRQMVANFLAGGAAINCFARLVGSRVLVVDFGVDAELAPREGLRLAKARRGTSNLARGPAMSREEALGAILSGAEVFREERSRGCDVVALGEMGIGNTTAASCLVSAFTGRPPGGTVGRGAGLDDSGLARKRAVVARALELHRPTSLDPLGTLAALGGFEIAGLVGVALEAARSRVPVLVDGFISSAAALAAARIAPGIEGFMIAAHRSAEPGHRAALEALGLEPLLELGMRLGEGTGAALAMTLLEASTRVLREMATFEGAGVADAGR